MSQPRFVTVRDLFDAYPSAAGDVGAADDNMRSLDLVRTLASKRDWQPAISFCAYLLPRRVAVAWACRSVRRLADRLVAEEDRMIGFAEAWVDEPEEPRRRKALAAGTIGDPRSSATWVALAAGWSGGSVVPEDMGYAPADPEQTAKAVRVALFIALSRLEPDAVKHRLMTACLQDGIQFASGESVSSP
jgi:uncharacterized protein DUF6931